MIRLSLFAASALTLGLPAAAQQPAVLHKTLKVGDLDIFYRESGPKDAPALLLLHDFPTSSQMFRNLIPALGEKFHAHLLGLEAPSLVEAHSSPADPRRMTSRRSPQVKGRGGGPPSTGPSSDLVGGGAGRACCFSRGRRRPASAQASRMWAMTVLTRKSSLSLRALAAKSYTSGHLRRRMRQQATSQGPRPRINSARH